MRAEVGSGDKAMRMVDVKQKDDRGIRKEVRDG